ncbi:c-type cytochrome [Vreelandella utahensis]|uniref:c-type cytochrome n=1 Tax=Vreelandella halophila TaxID=86177 RepID=UPI000986B302|nr:c-type cytochrome [Halomonas utahensis]
MKIMIKPIAALGAVLALGAASTGMAQERSGEEIYNNYCSTCHKIGAAGAPKLDAADEWQSRVDERGREGLYENSINGFKGMPPKGTCGDCSESEMKAAVDYMLGEAIE